MKKLILPVFALIVMGTMSSCLFKTYNCKCTTVDSNFGTSVENNSVLGGIFAGGKSGAKNECATYESSSSTRTTTCTLE